MTNIKVEKGEEDGSSRGVNVSSQGSASLDSHTIKTELSSRQLAKKQPESFQSANQHPPSYPQENARRANRPSNPPSPPRLQSPVHFSFVPRPSNPISNTFNPEEQTYLAVWQRRGLHKEIIISSFETTFKKRVEQRSVKSILTRLEKIGEVADQLVNEAPSYAWWTPETETQRRAGERFKAKSAARRRLKEGKLRATRPFVEDVSEDPIPTSQNETPVQDTAPVTAASSKTSTAPSPALRPLDIAPPPRAPRLAPLLAYDRLPSSSHHRHSRQNPRTPPLSPLPKPAPATLPVTPGSIPGAAITFDSDDDEDGWLNPDDKLCFSAGTATPFVDTPRLPPPNYHFMSPSDPLQIPAQSQQSRYGASRINPNYNVDPSRYVSMSPLTLDSPFEYPSQQPSTGWVLDSDARFPQYPPPDIRSPLSSRRPSQPTRPAGSPQGPGNRYFYPPMEDMDQVAARARTARSVDIRRDAPRAHPFSFQSNSYLCPAPASPPPRLPQPSRPTGLPQPRVTSAGTQKYYAPTQTHPHNSNLNQRARGDAHQSFSPERMEEGRMRKEEEARHMERLRMSSMDTLRTSRRML